MSYSRLLHRLSPAYGGYSLGYTYWITLLNRPAKPPKECTMPALSRRQLIKGLLTLSVSASLPGLTACNSLQPKPFATGRTITPPQGCTELLARDQRGDC